MGEKHGVKTIWERESEGADREADCFFIFRNYPPVNIYQAFLDNIQLIGNDYTLENSFMQFAGLAASVTTLLSCSQQRKEHGERQNVSVNTFRSLVSRTINRPTEQFCMFLQILNVVEI